MKNITRKETTLTKSHSSASFFNKSNEESFFSSSQKGEKPFFNPSALQTKLSVGEPEDQYEKEADLMAEKVVQGNTNQHAPVEIQRNPENPEPEEELQRKEEEREELQVMEKSNRVQKNDSSESDGNSDFFKPTQRNIEKQLQHSKGNGQPLSKEIRAQMEPGLGASFENVTIHTDENAVQMNNDLNAQAFTSGRDIYFNRGKFNPEKKEGKKLIAHELTHVVQQTGKGNADNLNTLQTSSVQKKTKSKNSGSPTLDFSKSKISLNRLPNGQEQMIQQMPFKQEIEQPVTPVLENEPEQNPVEEPIFVSNIEPTTEILTSSSDSINSTLTHLATVASGRVPDPGNFGTTGASVRISNVLITSGSGVYTVTGNFVHTITYGVLSGTGPNNQVDIQNENDNDIKACNYQLVSSDLTPNMASDNGRPPRTKYWAEDLTIRHERFHAVDQRQLSWGPQVNTAMQNWLNGQTSSSASNIRNTLLPQAINEGIRVYNAFVALPSTEGDTYGDGAPLYRARANTIKTKGDAGDYGQVAIRVTVHPKGGGTYEVVAGDTLWAIAERTYGNGRYWRRIHEANPGKARNNGNLIFPGQIFDLPAVNIDQEVGLLLQFGASILITSNVVIPGGSSHVFTELPNNVFDDTTNCAGNLNVEVFDANVNTLLSTNWAIPANSTARNNNIEVALEITNTPAP